MDKPITHEIVSNVDTIIILKHPCVEFAEWGRSAPSTIEEIEEATWKFSRAMRQKKVGKKKSTGFVITSLNESAANDGKFGVANNAPPIDGGPSTATLLGQSSKRIEHSIFGARPSEFKQEITIPKVVDPWERKDHDDPSNAVEINDQDVEPVPEVTIQPIEDRGIRFRVCAGNLMSASPWFKRVLNKNGWMESNWKVDDRLFYISAEDWDEEAFIILMNIFHLRNHNVPRTLKLEMLAKIAVLVDYYECGESIELFTDMWVADLRVRTPIPTTYCQTLILWIWVSWAFKLSDLYKQATAVAIKQCTEPVRNLGLPIPARITD
ncbi:hypothetical protein E8E12_001115 [Didymella heteroderae]|uniref:BTB domain-containing protein n=1 Tax=Didymella heteroderae TaxID=1769908 RepID=A0A9P4WH08_9PLEO|nr:hypothetical protein E8E12_001115 [Didymella heteroderae]